MQRIRCARRGEKSAFAIADSIHRRIVRGFRDKAEPGAETRGEIAPHTRRAFQFQNIFLVGAMHKPRALGEFTFKLAARPPCISHECAHGVMLRGGQLFRLFERKVMAALEDIRLRMPAKRREEQLIRLHRPALQHRHARKLPERLLLQQVADVLARRPIQNEPETPVCHAVIRQHDDRAVEVRVHHARMSDQQTARECGSDDRFAHTGTIASPRAGGK